MSLRPFFVLCALALAALAPAPALVAEAAPTLDAIELDVRDLTSFEWEPGDPIPSDITRYDGRRVIVRGYMHQSVDSMVTQFPLVSDSCQCNERLLPHHFIDVELTRGETDLIPGEFEVIGKLSVGEEEDEDGFITRLFHLRGTIF